MTAQNNLNQQQFYHVTRHEFSPGELITTPVSRRAPNRFNEGSTAQNRVTQEHIYFTPDIDFAHTFGNMVRTNSEAETPLRIYEVAPTGKISKDRHTHSAEAYKSKEPLTVVSEVHRTFGLHGPGSRGSYAERKVDMDKDRWEQLHYPGRWADKHGKL